LITTLSSRNKGMHIQVINFNLEGITRADYEALCDELAGAFSDLPGLISKHWLADEENNTYGGVYIWETRDAYQAYLSSELFAGVGAHPALVNIESKDYGVLEAPTRVTRGL
jgi:heme-degrading monooxygenase HmoA